jgi:hypothetical protein
MGFFVGYPNVISRQTRKNGGGQFLPYKIAFSVLYKNEFFRMFKLIGQDRFSHIDSSVSR